LHTIRSHETINAVELHHQW
jgi:hypothetical protein